ncbi:lysoplasmalogenase [uncultured Thioclava sp.]|uniref:lysoplasmalogenase n=1 Tax=uncultured Thioclava sp. TaxID=473858 RepID=UPI0025F8A5B1|nr:lysoplasmalogenase [uncultured Thioclava sp.]
MTIFLLLPFAAALMLAVLYLISFAGATPSWRKTAIKTSAVACLVPLALMLHMPGWIVIGLALGAVGDFALSRPGQGAFLAGMVAFAAGHLAYLVAFIGLGAQWPNWPATAVMVMLAGAVEIWVVPHTGALRWPVRGYILVIVAMAIAAMGLPPEATALSLGVVLFVTSDAILSVETFVMQEGARKRLASRALWLFYWSGQALIAIGLALAPLFTGPAMN